MKGSTVTVIGGVLTIFGAAVTLVGGYVSSQQKAATDKQLISGNQVLQDKVDSTKDALILKGEELAGVQRDLAATQVALTKKTDENAALNKKFADYAMGADSFFYLHLVNFGGTSPQAVVVHVGHNPVRDTEVVSNDVTAQMPDIFAQRVREFDLPESTKRATGVDVSQPHLNGVLVRYIFETNPVGENYFFLVRYFGGSGSFRQILNLAKVNGHWKQAYLVERIDGDDNPKPVGAHFDPEFPVGPGYLANPKHYPELQLKKAIKKYIEQHQ